MRFKIIKNRKRFLSDVLILIHILFAIFGLFFYLANYRLSENILIQRSLNKQQIIAKAGSQSVENLLITAQNELNSFVFSLTKVSDFSIIDIDNMRQGFMSYMKRAQLPVNGIAYYDETGKLTVIENRRDLRIGEGQDFSKTPPIIWSKNPMNKDKTFISTPYLGTTGASVGKIILVVAKPIYFGNTYKGTLTIRILVDDLRKAFVDPLASDLSEDSFIVDSRGVLLAGRADLLNKNLFLYANTKKWKGYSDFTKKFSLSIQTNTTQTTWTFQNPQELPKLFLVGVSKIDIPNTNNDLYMTVATPRDSALTALRPLNFYGFAWVGLGVVLTVLGGIIVMILQTEL